MSRKDFSVRLKTDNLTDSRCLSQTDFHNKGPISLIWPEKMNSNPILSYSCAVVVALFALQFALPTSSMAQDNQARNIEIALKRQPMQKGVDCDMPELSTAADCTTQSSQELFGSPGFLVKNSQGQIVRLYTKLADKSVHWTFFKNNNEVYRESDINGDGKVDRFQWMGVAGSRIGNDTNQNGTIDAWERISAEEVAMEVFQAFQAGDDTRFIRLCLKNDDLTQLRLGTQMQKRVADAVNKNYKGIKALMAEQRDISPSSEFVDFGGRQPSLVPKGKLGLGEDLIIHDGVIMLYANGSKTGSLSMGTMVQVGDRWRIMELPELIGSSGTVTNGHLFDLLIDPGKTVKVDAELNSLMAKYTEIDKNLQEAKDSAKSKLYNDRTDVMLQIIPRTQTDEDKSLWIRMVASEASIGFQTSEYPKGLEVLESLMESPVTEGHREYVGWELIQAKSIDAEIQDIMEMLEIYVGDFPKAENTPRALLQLAQFEEFSSSSNSEDAALKWYAQAATDFSDSLEGRFAAGAKRRLNAYGEKLSLTGRTLDNKQLNIARYAGKKMVLVHYWSTQDELSTDDFELLISIRDRNPDDLQIVGVNLDDEAATALAYLKASQPKVNWPHLWAAGGKTESPHALYLGVNTVPLNLLLDNAGTVVENRIGTEMLDSIISRLRRKQKQTDK